MAIALLGVMGMQFYFFRESYQLQSKLFDQSVHEALSNVVEKIAKRDANTFLEKKAETLDVPEAAPRVEVPQLVNRRKKNKRPRMSEASYMLAEQRKADSIFSIRDSMFRAQYPNVFIFNDAVSPEELANLEYNLRVDVTQYEDAFGQVREQTRQTISRALNSQAAANKFVKKFPQTVSQSFAEFLPAAPF